MPNKPLTIKVPGKLMIAGEFAVLEPNHKLVAMAVDRFVYASLLDSKENRVTLNNLDLIDASWSYKNKAVVISTDDPRARFVEFAMEMALNYLEEQSYSVEPFVLSIKSELDDESGVKYGLGSSAAVVTAVISVILTRYLPKPPAAELVFKLAAIAHVITQGNGSGADVAASSYGGVIEYTSFQAEWLIEAYNKKQSLTALIDQDWIYLSVKEITLPEELHILIGWTGSPASTSQLVNKISVLKTEERQKYEFFLNESESSVRTFLKGVQEKDPELILKGIEHNRQALSQMGKDARVEIETPLLKTLSDLAKQNSGAGKQSGAGGGDCGIAFLTSDKQRDQLCQDWERVGIKPLELQPFLESPTLI